MDFPASHVLENHRALMIQLSNGCRNPQIQKSGSMFSPIFELWSNFSTLLWIEFPVFDESISGWWFQTFFYFPQYIQYMGSSFPLTFIFFSMVIAPPTRKHRTDFLFNSPEIGLSRVAFSRHRKGRCPIWRPCRCTRCDAHPASMVHHIYFIWLLHKWPNHRSHL